MRNGEALGLEIPIRMEQRGHYAKDIWKVESTGLKNVYLWTNNIH